MIKSVKFGLLFSLALISCPLFSENRISKSRGEHASVWHRLKRLCSLDENLQLSEKNEFMIRAMLKKVGIIENIIIRRISKLEKLLIGSANAFIYGTSEGRKGLAVDEEWFNTLSFNQQEYLIAHEGSHVFLNHSFETVTSPVLIVLLPNVSYSLYKHISCKKLPYESLLLPLNGPASLLLSNIILGHYSRKLEREADINAAYVTDPDFGWELFDRMEQSENSSVKSPLARCLKGVGNILRFPFRTHPTFKERKAYLKKLSEKKRRND